MRHFDLFCSKSGICFFHLFLCSFSTMAKYPFPILVFNRNALFFKDKMFYSRKRAHRSETHKQKLFFLRFLLSDSID